VTGAVKEGLTLNSKEITAKVLMLAILQPSVTGRCNSLLKEEFFLEFPEFFRSIVGKHA
jgi:hypothetical protein